MEFILNEHFSYDLSTDASQRKICKGKIFQKCELAAILEKHFDQSQINDCRFIFQLLKTRLFLQYLLGICLLEKESEFNTRAIGKFNGKKHLGLFQISDKWWCKWDRQYNLGCGNKCGKFIDDNITDDINCAKKIFKETANLSGNGFNAW